MILGSLEITKSPLGKDTALINIDGDAKDKNGDEILVELRDALKKPLSTIRIKGRFTSQNYDPHIKLAISLFDLNSLNKEVLNALYIFILESRAKGILLPARNEIRKAIKRDVLKKDLKKIKTFNDFREMFDFETYTSRI